MNMVIVLLFGSFYNYNVLGSLESSSRFASNKCYSYFQLLTKLKQQTILNLNKLNLNINISTMSGHLKRSLENERTE